MFGEQRLNNPLSISLIWFDTLRAASIMGFDETRADLKLDNCKKARMHNRWDEAHPFP